MFDLRQLRYFVAVAEAEHVGRAAEKLHISASPLSRQILALEAELGAALFLRHKQRLKLTRAGRNFLAEAKALLAHAEALRRRARSVGDLTSATLSVGYVESAIHGGVLGADLRAFRRRHPDVKVELKNLRSAEQAAALQAGAIDVAYPHSVPAAAKLKAVRVLDEPFLLAIPVDHPLAKSAGSGAVTPRALDGQSFISMSAAAAPEVRRRLMAVSAACGFRPDVRYEAMEPSVVLGLVAAGLGLAILQQSLCRRSPPGVVWRPMPRNYGSKLTVYRATLGKPGPLAAAYLAALRIN